LIVIDVEYGISVSDPETKNFPHRSNAAIGQKTGFASGSSAGIINL
jgi:hypothetical protein